jgi:acyl-CoA synthetase (AMP-forming)/AMP-acid ligase II
LSALETVGGRGAALAILRRSGVLGDVLGGGLPHRTVGRVAAYARLGPTLAGTFAAGRARAPKRVAVTDGRRSVTYAELDERVRRVAAGLAALGAGPDRPVATYQRNSVDAVETLVAASRVGANTLLLTTFLSPIQVTELLHRERPAVLVVDDELRPNVVDVPEGTTVVVSATEGVVGYDEYTLEDLAECGEPDVGVPAEPGRLIVLTSGTTGVPRGARLSAPSGLGPAAAVLSRIPFRAPETIVVAPPLFHTWGLAMLRLAPTLNATVVLRRRPEPENLLAAVTEHRATSLALVPLTMQRLLDLPDEARVRYDTSSLRVVAASSAPIPKDVCTSFQDRFGDILYNLYGTTEASWVTVATPEELRLAPGTVGRPPWGTRLALLGEDRRPVPRGEVGRIFVGNELLFEGYTSGEQKEQVRGLMATGDRGDLDENNQLTVHGRDDDMVIVEGEHVYPAAVEEVIGAQPEVKEAAVVGLPDGDLGSRLVAYVVRRDGADLTGDDVRARARQRVARFAVPRDVVFLECLPRNATGKVVPRMLPAPRTSRRARAR